MRYIKIPGPLTVSVETTSGPSSLEVSFDDVVKILLTDQRSVQTLDRAARKSVRKALLGQKPGEVIGLRDEHWAALEAIVRNPQTLSTQFLDADADAGDPMLGAIADASTKDPEES